MQLHEVLDTDNCLILLQLELLITKCFFLEIKHYQFAHNGIKFLLLLTQLCIACQLRKYVSTTCCDRHVINLGIKQDFKKYI